MYAVAVAPLLSDELLLSFELLLESVSFPDRVFTGEGVEVEPRLPAVDFRAMLFLAVSTPGVFGSSAGGAATATLTRASNAELPPCEGCNAIMDLREGVSPLLYATDDTIFLERPVELLRDILARVEPERGR